MIFYIHILIFKQMKTDINIYILFGILIIHWFADFVLQTDQMAKNKSTSNYWLTKHVYRYTTVWVAAMFIYCAVLYGITWTPEGVRLCFLFPIITFVCHWLTDYLTSRLNTRLHKKGDIHNFFVSIGADQVYHYVQLVLTFQLLS